MKISLSQIKAFVDIDLSPAKIGEVLTLAGIEVDRIENEVPHFAGVVAAKVVAVKPHPEAKTLVLAEVDDGQKKHHLVCGASNCRAGLRTAFAKPGALVQDRRIEKATIRGVNSDGMLCSATELGLYEDHAGILELPEEIPLGHDLVKALWDPVFELSLTPNLGHCMSALGIARELCAHLKLKLKVKEQPIKATAGKAIVHDKKLCPRYLALLIEEIEVHDSPFSMKAVMAATGHKAINHVVDATNWTMLNFGQPLHAFDADLIEGALEVGPAKAPFKFLCLDGIEREVPKGALLISDSRKPVAIAGVMGGINSAVTDKTKRILLEAAQFDPISIRKTARSMDLRTESAQRFEKGVDPLGLTRALSEAARLIGGRVKSLAQVAAEEFVPRTISYRPERINQLLGTKLSETEIEELFRRLDLNPKGKKVSVPSYRFDLMEEIDLVEEAARIYGYNNIEKGEARISTSDRPNDPVFLFENRMRRKFTGLGLTEFLNCDLIGPKLLEIAEYVAPPSMKILRASYTKSEEYSALRTSLLPGLLQSARANFDQQNHRLAAFEIGRIHFLEKDSAVEIPMGAILLSGKADLPHWSQKGKEVDFFDLKGMIESLFGARFLSSKQPALHPGRQADIVLDDLLVGSLGQVHPHLLAKFGIESPLYYAEVNLLSLMKGEKENRKMKPLAQFPSSVRDWTVPIAKTVPVGMIFDRLEKNAPPLLEKAELIDLYQPESGVQNATFRFTYRDLLKTISFEEVDSEHSRITQDLLNLLAK